MKRWPGVRHVRYVVHNIRFWIWWNRIGRYLGAFPNERDFKHLDDIWEGKA